MMEDRMLMAIDIAAILILVGGILAMGYIYVYSWPADRLKMEDETRGLRECIAPGMKFDFTIVGPLPGEAG